MARTVLTVHAPEERNAFSPVFGVLTQALDAEAGAEFAMEGQDDRYLLLIQNAASSAKTVTVKAGNGSQGAADRSAEVAANSYTCLTLESGYFKQVYGADRGKILIRGTDANIKAAVFRLP